jgi:hypothetical protein
VHSGAPGGGGEGVGLVVRGGPVGGRVAVGYVGRVAPAPAVGTGGAVAIPGADDANEGRAAGGAVGSGVGGAPHPATTPSAPSSATGAIQRITALIVGAKPIDGRSQ